MLGSKGRFVRSNRPADSEVHVWSVRLAAIEQHWPDWQQVLSVDEIAKIDRFVRASDRNRSGTTRALLRRLLGGYLEIRPAEVRFSYNRFGKPGLAPANIPDPLRFSVSHSGAFAMFGFARGRLIGVDVEAIRADWNYRDLAAAICTERESKTLELLEEPRRAGELGCYWTLKEAYLKAIGVGLSFPYRRIEVAGPMLGVENPRRQYTLNVRGRWSVFPIRDIPESAGAVVVAGEAVRLSRYSMDWDPE